MNLTLGRDVRVLIALMVAGAGLASCGGGDDSVATDTAAPVLPSAAALTASCPNLLGVTVPGGGSVTTAVFTAATAAPVTASSFPDHCLTRGAINSRTGVDGRPYALGFELRLPLNWNSRFFYQGGSGVDGTLFTATGAYGGGGNTRNALLDGYAVITTDSGHLAVPGVADGAYLFAADPQARLEYGNAQIPLIVGAAQALISQYYGFKPVRSYFLGCSNGGRQAMIAAQQYPALFDGIVAASPGFRLAQASIQALFQAQLTATVAPLGSTGRPDITKGLTSDEQTTVSNRILATCDALDGATDGMVSKMSACHPDPATWVCAAGETTNCLTAAKADYVTKLIAGAKTSTGGTIYAPWPYDPGMALQAGNPFYSIFAGEASHIYTSPPTITADLLGYGLAANIDAEFAKLFTTSGIYTTPGVVFTNGDSPNMDAFKARGGKLLMYNGSADLAFSINDVEKYYKQVQTRYGTAATADFARAFFVPGMAHCSGGKYGTDQFDAFGAMVNWVEKGSAPDVIVSTARAAAGVAWPGRTRPLCAYPKEASYKGSGSIEDAANFTCQ
jgi:pimeloyl-ACP methyl ester carboxylesterase